AGVLVMHVPHLEVGRSAAAVHRSNLQDVASRESGRPWRAQLRTYCRGSPLWQTARFTACLKTAKNSIVTRSVIPPMIEGRSKAVFSVKWAYSRSLQHRVAIHEDDATPT